MGKKSAKTLEIKAKIINRNNNERPIELNY
jgi:hypothetical protein